MHDRTGEFVALASEARRRKRAAGSGVVETGVKADRGLKARTQEAIQFKDNARNISDGINRATERLERLAMLTQAKSTFEDPTVEINMLASQVQEDVNLMGADLSRLQSYLASNQRRIGGGSKAAQDHSETVVKAIGSQLQKATKEFQGVLKSRSDVMKEQIERRGQLGTVASRPLARPLKFGAPLRPRDGLPRPFDPNTNGTNSNNQSMYAESSAATAGGSNGTQQQEQQVTMTLLDTAQLSADQEFFQDRANSMQFIEAQLHKIDTVMGSMAQLLSDQREDVLTLNHDTEAAFENMSMARNELFETLKAVSSNRMLMAKILAVLLFFMTFFIVFLA